MRTQTNNQFLMKKKAQKVRNHNIVINTLNNVLKKNTQMKTKKHKTKTLIIRNIMIQMSSILIHKERLLTGNLPNKLQKV